MLKQTSFCQNSFQNVAARFNGVVLGSPVEEDRRSPVDSTGVHSPAKVYNEYET